MYTLLDEFDFLFKEGNSNNSTFSSILGTRQSYPVNIYTNNEGLKIELACVGVNKEDIKITTNDGVLRIQNLKSREWDNEELLIQKISQKSFDLKYKIASKFNLEKMDAKLEMGLLTISIPLKKGLEEKEIEIK